MIQNYAMKKYRGTLYLKQVKNAYNLFRHPVENFPKFWLKIKNVFVKQTLTSSQRIELGKIETSIIEQLKLKTKGKDPKFSIVLSKKIWGKSITNIVIDLITILSAMGFKYFYYDRAARGELQIDVSVPNPIYMTPQQQKSDVDIEQARQEHPEFFGSHPVQDWINKKEPQKFKRQTELKPWSDPKNDKFRDVLPKFESLYDE